ncbi:MAG TPA: hypothetical protein VKE74_05320 [Gemmataceae bacterium]|nr:hypothetical protein [Gemmataceae bacterium]
MPLFRLPSAMDLWLPAYLRQTRRRWAGYAGEVHLLLCVADHYEPNLGGASEEVAARRVGRWVSDYPRHLGGFTDSDGRPPRHSFFYPIETYHADHLDALGELCRQGYGEIEVHLHHDNDTADNLRARLTGARELFATRHRQLARDRRTGETRYGFVHGNWALDNSHPEARCCGVNNELDVLRQTGCYADFTMPSAPHRAQTRTINSIYYAVDDPARPKSHDTGTPVGSGPPPADSLMMIQGPLVLNWSSRKWGVLPRVENGCIQGNQPATIGRVKDWLRARVQVPTRPDWCFVKLHTHGANEQNMPVLLGEPMVRFHRDLARLAAENPMFQYHYVSAREMYNLARAAEDGWAGSVADARDYELGWNGAPQGGTAGAGGAPSLDRDAETLAVE